MEFQGRCMERVRVVWFFDEAGGGDSPNHLSRASEAPQACVLFDAGWSYRRRPSSSLKRAVGRSPAPDQLEQPWKMPSTN
jgi:hypothetical protein